jgi:putative hydrolase
MSNSLPRFFRFRDLDQEKINVEYQVHTDQTDGEATPGQLLGVALERGISALAFTEHVRKDTKWFQTFADKIREISRMYAPMTTYVGCETKALDARGTLDVNDEILAASDVVLGSVHRFPDGKGGYLRDLSATDLANMECELSIGMMLHAPINVLAHPGGMSQRRHGSYPQSLFRELLTTSVETGVAVEISTSYLVDISSFLELCQEVNPYVSVGSDVHALEDVGQCRDTLTKLMAWTK